MGYFNIIQNSDVCVFYDTASYSKNTFHNRNNILLSTGMIFNWSLPLKKFHLGATFSDIKINYTNKSLSKLSKTIEQNFSSRKHYFIIKDILSKLENDQLSLAEINIYTIRKLANFLGIKSEFYNASDLQKSNDNFRNRSEKLIDILDLLGATHYVSTENAMEYLLQDKFDQMFSGEILPVRFECAQSIKLLGTDERRLSALSLILEDEN
jgi:hypothetical protein